MQTLLNFPVKGSGDRCARVNCRDVLIAPLVVINIDVKQRTAGAAASVILHDYGKGNRFSYGGVIM